MKLEVPQPFLKALWPLCCGLGLDYYKCWRKKDATQAVRSPLRKAGSELLEVDDAQVSLAFNAKAKEGNLK